MSTKKIKILFRHRSMEMGGVEKVLLSLLNNLNKDRFDITVLLSIDQGELRNEIPAHVKKVFLAKGKESFSRNPFLQKLQLFVRKLKLDKLRRNPEIIDNQYLKDTFDIEIGMTYNDFEPVLNSSNKNSKKIGWFHTDITSKGLIPILPKLLSQIPKFDYFIFGSISGEFEKAIF